jgi:hypothetical protein
MLLHANEGLYPKAASRKEAFGKYFAFCICAVKEEGSCNIRNPCFASMALLKIIKSPNSFCSSYFSPAHPMNFGGL